MEGWLWGTAGVALIAAVVAIRLAARLAQELDRLKREQRDAGAKLKQLGEDLKNTVEPLRVHLATVAGGRPVPRELVLSGRLYVSVSALEAQRLCDAAPGQAVLVDVRSPREYAVKRMAGAKLVPIEEMEQRYQADIPEEAGKVFIYCATGERSRLACDFLSRKGYANLYHIRDGLQGWSGPTEGEGALTLIQIERKI
nr:rhodanese-like domain-containing protein [Nitrospirota bacterium]